MRTVDGEPVGEVDHRVRPSRELLSLRYSQRGTHEGLPAKGGTCRAELSGDDQLVARSCASAPAEITPGNPIQTEMHTFDERVLREHDTSFELRSIMLDALGEAPTLELSKQAELAELREPHRSPRAAPRHDERHE